MALESGVMSIFAGTSGTGLARGMCAYAGCSLGTAETIRFSDGNTFVRIGENVRNKDVYIVQPIGLHPNEEFVELLFWLDAFKRASAETVTAIVPYLGYAKGDKKDEPRVSIRARVCAECIELEGADRIVTLDLHSPQIQGFFKKPVDHLFAYPVLCEYVKMLGLRDPVVVSPDAGFAKRARLYAGYMGASLAIGDKVRRGHTERSDVAELIGDVDGKDALITDDFTLTAGTITNMAAELRNRGARTICACVSHLLLREEGVARVERSPLELLVGTDSVDNPYLAASGKIRRISVAPLLAEAVIRIHARESVSSLFDALPRKVLEGAFDETGQSAVIR